MPRLTASLREERSPSLVRRVAEFDGGSVWWEVSGEALPPKLSAHDLAATALVHLAMHRKQDLHIAGPVTRSLLEGLEDYVALWSVWRPDLYQAIEVSAAEEVQGSVGPDNRAIAAFSGGVDATFTMWRHTMKRAGRRSRDVVAGTLIHGLDLPLNNDEAIASAHRTASETLASVGVPLAITRTNWRDLCVDWEMEFGVGVASCLRNWQGAAGYALLGSDEDYTRLVAPWGGHPLPYGMASSTDFQVVYDGGEFSRTEKVAALADWAVGVRNLRVCWQGPMTGQNCGVCEKCLRTKMNFMASGIDPPAGLGPAVTPAQVRGLVLHNEGVLVLMEEIAATARQGGIKDPWVDALAAKISSTRLKQAAKRLPVVQALKRVRRKLGAR